MLQGRDDPTCSKPLVPFVVLRRLERGQEWQFCGGANGAHFRCAALLFSESVLFLILFSVSVLSLVLFQKRFLAVP